MCFQGSSGDRAGCELRVAWSRCFSCYLYCCVRCCGLASSLFVLADNGNCCFILLIDFPFFFLPCRLRYLYCVQYAGHLSVTYTSHSNKRSANCFASLVWVQHFALIRTGASRRRKHGLVIGNRVLYACLLPMTIRVK